MSLRTMTPLNNPSWHQYSSASDSVLRKILLWRAATVSPDWRWLKDKWCSSVFSPCQLCKAREQSTGPELLFSILYAHHFSHVDLSELSLCSWGWGLLRISIWLICLATQSRMYITPWSSGAEESSPYRDTLLGWRLSKDYLHLSACGQFS